ncbi:MAG: YqhA family protein [Candidatus Methanofastidiosia archaeon]
MDRIQIENLFKGEKYHDLIMNGFLLGRYTIIYGSIFFLTILGVIVWISGAIGLFFFIIQSTANWIFPDGTQGLPLQQMQTNAIVLLDLYLLSVVLFIVAIGLYGIFVTKETSYVKQIKLPVKITDISELERYLFGTIVTILLVAALNRILNPGAIPTPEDVITIGMICAIVLVISIYLTIQRPKEKNGKEKEKKDQ